MIVWLATDSAEVVKVACPEAMATLAARELARAASGTVPLGVPAPGAAAETMAVKVTAWLNTEGLAVELTVVVLASLLTTCGEAESLALLLTKLLSPE